MLRRFTSSEDENDRLYDMPVTDETWVVITDVDFMGNYLIWFLSSIDEEAGKALQSLVNVLYKLSKRS